MSPEHIYVYTACQIVMSETGQQWTYCVMFDDEHYEPYPPRAFDSEEDALKAATEFCDNRIDNITPIDGFHRRRNMSLSADISILAIVGFGLGTHPGRTGVFANVG